MMANQINQTWTEHNYLLNLFIFYIKKMVQSMATFKVFL